MTVRQDLNKPELLHARKAPILPILAAMPRLRSIAILLHEHAHGAERAPYRLWAIAENWKRWGIRVDVLLGAPPSGNIDADVLVPHIDLSFIPDHLSRVIEAHPRALNRRRRDIRKHAISTNLVHPGDGFTGPVIVKTTCNCGGWADAAYADLHHLPLSRRLLRKLQTRPRLEPYILPWARALRRYPIYRSPRDVPRGVWRNPHLVVERYTPERRGEQYVMRMWVILGPSTLGRTLGSPDPYVKDRLATLEEMPDAPPEVRAWPKELGLDYGKLDYLMHTAADGSTRPVLIDVNTTPTVSGDPRSEKYILQNENLARGITAWGEIG